ncbi:hypothetical protein HDU84_000014 [Entophlyctis sp. JEL0112]|nr:hypothetical protein HDU84_000014 [Entophlyctis sp. JEL0112]
MRSTVLNASLLLFSLVVLLARWPRDPGPLAADDDGSYPGDTDDAFSALTPAALAAQMRHVSTPVRTRADAAAQAAAWWRGQMQCLSPRALCRARNVFFFNNSLHLFLIDDFPADGDGVAASYAALAISSTMTSLSVGLPGSEPLPVRVHKNLKPTDLLLREVGPVRNETAIILDMDACKSVSDVVDLLAAAQFSHEGISRRTRIVTRYRVLPTIFRQILLAKSSHNLTTLSLGSKKHPAGLFPELLLGIDQQFWIGTNYSLEIWDDKILKLYADLTQEIHSLRHEDAKNLVTVTEKSPKNTCLFDPNEDLNVDEFALDLAKMNERLTFVSGLEPDLESTLNIVQECNTILCHSRECENYLHLAAPGSTIVALVTNDTEYALKPQLLELLNITQLTWALDTAASWTSESSPLDLKNLFRFLTMVANFNTLRFTTFMPWEQLNNQLIGFKSTCAIAALLNRTLILPLVGQRNAAIAGSAEWDFSFNVDEYAWSPMSRYFDLHALQTQLACAAITPHNFFALWRRQHGGGAQPQIDHAVFNPVARATAPQQLVQYYARLGLALPAHALATDYPRLAALTAADVLSRWGDATGGDNQQQQLQNVQARGGRVLAFGAAFWLYGFGAPAQEYPLRTYAGGYMRDGGYAATTAALRGTRRIRTAAAAALAAVRARQPRVVAAVHVRRADYWAKCRRIADATLRAMCFPPDDAVRARVLQTVDKAAAAAARGVWPHQRARRLRPVVYVATNIGGFRREMEALKADVDVVYFEDLFAVEQYDAIEQALLDIEICSAADAFLGNIYSSFSRTIFERRELVGKPFDTF